MSTLGAGAGPSTETAWRQLCDEEVSAFGVAHFVQPGGLDPSFDGDGVATAGFTGSTIAEDVLIQPDRKVVIAASVDPPGPGLDNQFAVARFTSTGALDPALGDGGRVVTDVSATGDYAYAVALQDDGRIVVAGSSVGDNPIDMLVARYLPNASSMRSFDGDGKVTLDFGAAEAALDVALQVDGKIVVVGYTLLPGVGTDFALARLNRDGSFDTRGLDPYLDAPFGAGGKVTTNFEGGSDVETSVAIESRQILVAGFVDPAAAIGGDDGDLARYRVDGSLDPGFGVGRKVTTDLTEQRDEARGLALQPDGRIVLAGWAGVGTEPTSDVGLVRYLAYTTGGRKSP